MSPLQVEAYVLNSGISAPGAYTVTANSSQTINALILAISAAVSGSGGVGIAASGSGAGAVNQIAVDPQAYQNGDGSGSGAGVNVASLDFNATDASTIIANVAAASLAASFAGDGRRVDFDRCVAGDERDRRRRRSLRDERLPRHQDNERRHYGDDDRKRQDPGHLDGRLPGRGW